MTESKMFSVGDRVVYVSDRHSLGANNPLVGSKFECEGTVDSTGYGGSSQGLHVLWDNGHGNSYTNMDLQWTTIQKDNNPNLAFRIRKKRG